MKLNFWNKAKSEKDETSVQEKQITNEVTLIDEIDNTIKDIELFQNEINLLSDYQSEIKNINYMLQRLKEECLLSNDIRFEIKYMLPKPLILTPLCEPYITAYPEFDNIELKKEIITKICDELEKQREDLSLKIKECIKNIQKHNKL